MIRVTILYGHPTDPDAFLDYYEHTHVALAQKIPDTVSFTWGKCLPGFEGEAPPTSSRPSWLGRMPMPWVRP